MLLFKGDNDDNNIELAIDIIITKHNGEKSPLTKSYLKSLKSLAKSFINNRSKKINNKITRKFNSKIMKMIHKIIHK